MVAGENQQAVQGDVKTFEKQVASTSEQTTETYTREQVQKFVSDALAEQGRKHKTELSPIVQERDSLKAKMESNESELTEVNAEIEKLEAQIKDLSGDDAAKFDAIKELKVARDERRQLKAKERTLNEKERSLESKWGERIKKAVELEREVLVLEIVEDYEEGNADKLSSICSLMGITSDDNEKGLEDKIRGVADTLWSKKATPFTGVKPYSGMTIGGTGKPDLETLVKEGKNVKGKTYQEKVALQKQLEAARKAALI